MYHTYDWIIIIGYSKHKIDTKKHVLLPEKKKKDVISHPYLPITATFFCSQSGQCGAVKYKIILKKPLMRCGTIQTIRQIAIAWLESTESSQNVLRVSR